MVEQTATWDERRIASLAAGQVVLARDAGAHPVPMPFLLPGTEPLHESSTWREDLTKLVPDDHARMVQLWWQSLAAPAAPLTCGIRLDRAGDLVWHRLTMLNLLDELSVGVVLLFLTPDPEAAEPDEVHDEPGGTRRSPWLLQHLSEVGVIERSAGSAEELFGRTHDDLIGRPIIEFLHPDDLGAALPAWVKLLETPGSTCTVRQRLIHPDGTSVWIDSMLVNLLHDPDMRAVVGSSVDVSAEETFRRALRASERRFRALATSLPIGMFACDQSGLVTFGNETWNAYAGHVKRLAEVFTPYDRELFEASWSDLVSGASQVMSIDLRTYDGLRVLRLRSQAVRDDDGTVLEVVGTADDVTESVVAVEGLRREADRDPLTGLPNRRALDGLWSSLREGPATLLFIDLDGFKRVNDEAGHHAGDRVLVEVARRLEAAVRPGDHVARFGGDEFVAICPGIATSVEAEDIVARIQAILGDRSEQDLPWIAGASIGVAIGSSRDRLVDLVRHSDQEMYHQKSSRRRERAAVG